MQKDIADSSRQLIVDKITEHDLHGFYDVGTGKESRIYGANGTQIIFRGMNNISAAGLKSLEGYDRCWVDEAAALSERSLRILRPTFRKAGSEMWFSWNPEFPTDAVDDFFRGEHPDPRSICVEANWRDNPWLEGTELYQDMLGDFRRDPETAEHVWNGAYNYVSEQYYYSKWIKAAEDEGRCGDFPHDPSLPVDTGWDLGVDDNTAVVFFQTDGEWVTVVDFWETSGEGAEQIIADALPEYTKNVGRYQALANLGRGSYTYRMHYFPHDIANREWGAGARSRVEIVMGLGIPQAAIHRGIATDPANRVQAVRSLMPRMRFNTANPRVAQLVTRLRRYARKWNEALGTYTGPLKDGNDHAADAFGEYCINSALAYEPAPEPKLEPTPEELGRIPLPPPPSVGGGSQRRGL